MKTYSIPCELVKFGLKEYNSRPNSLHFSMDQWMLMSLNKIKSLSRHLIDHTTHAQAIFIFLVI